MILTFFQQDVSPILTERGIILSFSERGVRGDLIPFIYAKKLIWLTTTTQTQ